MIIMTGEEVDRLIYQEKICPWLPPKIIDCHVHLGLEKYCDTMSEERRAEIWAMEVGIFQSWEQLRQTYRTLFPKQEVSVLAFGSVYREVNIEECNDYVSSGLTDHRNRGQGLLVTRPEWDAHCIEEAMSNGFIGIKPYPDLAPQHSQEVSIFDFVPKSHLAVLNRLGGVMMLHLPRAERLSDPNNIKELIEINDRYPDIRLIVAHIGRSYCIETAKAGLGHFVDRPSIYFDTAANLNADVFEYALETVGQDRILFGSDLPIMLMRGVREYSCGKYTNFTNGPYSWNTNRKSKEQEAQYTYYLYEEIQSIIEAVKRLGLGIDCMEKIMYSNSANLLGLPLRKLVRNGAQ